MGKNSLSYIGPKLLLPHMTMLLINFFSQYILGDLDTCNQGATIRVGLRPTTLRNGMVFLDSWPIKLYYENGRLKGRLQTSNQVWNVETSNFQNNKWQRVGLKYNF